MKFSGRINRIHEPDIDHIVEYSDRRLHGDRRVYIESKFTIRSLNQRTVNQLTNALRMAKSGDVVILNLARRATARELKALKKRVGPRRIKKIQVVHKQSDLFNLVKSTFEKELQ